MIDERKDSYGKDEERDLLPNLVIANEEFLDDGEQELGEAELIGMGSGLCLSPHLFKCLPSRKHVHVLHCWTRGEDTLANTEGCLIPATW